MKARAGQSPLNREELEQLYHVEGLSTTQIAERYGVSSVTVRNWMKKAGVELRRSALEIPIERLEQLYVEAGMTQAEVAAELGVSEDSVRRYLRKYGIPAHGKVDGVTAEEIEHLYATEGWTQQQIAERFGVSATYISRCIRQLGLEVRSQSDYQIALDQGTVEMLYIGQGLTLNQIGAHLGVSAATVRNRMKEWGIARRRPGADRYVPIEKEVLEDLYFERGMSITEIAGLLQCSSGVVLVRMHEHGIEPRPRGWDKLKCIVPAVKLGWSADFAYAVGLIASDGSLRTGCNEVKFATTDRELANNYCHALGLRPDDVPPELWPDPDAVPVHIYHDRRKPQYKPQYHVVFSDYRYRARLEEIGLTPNKSLTLGELSIPDCYFPDFLRGCFDGDGCWCVSRKYLIAVITSASPTFRSWLLDQLHRLTPIRGGSNRGIDIRFQGKGAVLLGHFMYYRPDQLALSRKRAIWEEHVEK